MMNGWPQFLQDAAQRRPERNRRLFETTRLTRAFVMLIQPTSFDRDSAAKKKVRRDVPVWLVDRQLRKSRQEVSVDVSLGSIHGSSVAVALTPAVQPRRPHRAPGRRRLQPLVGQPIGCRVKP